MYFPAACSSSTSSLRDQDTGNSEASFEEARWHNKSKGILDIQALLKAKLPPASKLKPEKTKAESEIF